MISSNPPQTKDELYARALALAGYSLADLAILTQREMPTNLLKNKGWIGQTIEMCLGATAGNLAEPDFPQLAIELKTLPIDEYGKPSETTYVCTAPLLNMAHVTWENSVAFKKLSCVLWVPIEASAAIPLQQRRVGMPILWQPSSEQARILREDYEELHDMICLGQLDQISARLGTYLHIRPKAANSQVLTDGIDSEGNKIKTLPRGYYLRTQLTQQILASGNYG